MRLRIPLAFLAAGGLAAGSMVEVFFFGTAILRGLPLKVQAYALWLPMPFFLLAGVLAGWGCRGGWRGITGFGCGALIPGFWVPTATMGTQGAARPGDLLVLTVAVPAAAYLAAGTVGGWASFRSWRGAMATGLGFAVGAVLAPAVAWMIPPNPGMAPLGLALVGWALPWLGGSLGAGWAARK